MVDPVGDNINFITDSIKNTTSSSLTITNVVKSNTGYFWVGTPSLNVCNKSLTVLTSTYVCTYECLKLLIKLYVCIAVYKKCLIHLLCFKIIGILPIMANWLVKYLFCYPASKKIVDWPIKLWTKV